MDKKLDINVLSIETTNRCNLNCPHCMLYEYGEKGTDYNDFITEETIDRIFDEDFNIRCICTLNFTGGEPLLNERAILYTIDKIIKEKLLVFSIDIATNGTILSRQVIDKLNEFYEYVDELCKQEPWTKIRKENLQHFINHNLVRLRISNNFHDNDAQKAFEFYKLNAKNAKVTMDDDGDTTKFRRVEWGKDNVLHKIAYSGRAKKLNSEFYVDTPCHKIVIEGKNQTMVKCPLKVMCNGDISIVSYCTYKDAHNNAIGNVHDKMSLRKMITEWNYKSTLTCDEACQLAEEKLYLEINRSEDISRVSKKVFGRNISLKELKEIIEKNSILYSGIENYRRMLHEKEPSLTPDEIEQASNYWIEYEKAKANEKSEKEIEEKNNTYINYLTQCVYDHYFDGVQEVHEEFPFLSSDECKELKECYRICTEEKDCNIYYYAAKAQGLMMINESRLRSAIIEEHEIKKIKQ